MTRFCASCGTEVDEAASFCPTCGEPIDQAAQTEIPEAPSWPDPEPEPEHEPEAEPAVRADARSPDEVPAAPAWNDQGRFDDRPTRIEDRPPDREADAPPPPPSDARSAAPAEQSRTSTGTASSSLNLPFTMPVTLSAWLIGGGAVVAALGLVIGLFAANINLIDVVLLLALVAIAATVFFSANVPDIPNLRLITLVVVLIGFGIALDRIGFGRAGVGDLLLFLGVAAAAIGAILLELGQDQPLGGPSRR